MWISSATTVTTTVMTSDSASRWKPMVGAKTPTVNQCHTVCVQACPAGSAMNTTATAIATTAESATAVIAMAAIARLGMRAPASASTTNPASGSAGMSQSSSRMSAPHARRHVRVERPPLPVKAQHERQPDRHLGCGHRQDEEEHHLAVGLLPARARDDERETRRVQHDLDRHEHEDHVVAREHADEAKHEQKTREPEPEIGRNRLHH